MVGGEPLLRILAFAELVRRARRPAANEFITKIFEFIRAKMVLQPLKPSTLLADFTNQIGEELTKLSCH